MRTRCVKCRGVDVVERVSKRGNRFYWCAKCRVYFMAAFTAEELSQIAKLKKMIARAQVEEHV